MFGNNLLASLVQVRQQVAELCSQERFLAARMLLTGGGFEPGAYPGLWSFLARRSQAAGHDAEAASLRGTLWTAGYRSANLAMQDAAAFLEAEDAGSAIFVLETVFGRMPQDRAARHLLARCHLARARARPARSKLRTNREVALRLTDGIEITTPLEAMTAIDLLRFSGELKRAEALISEARERFPDDIRFVMRRARLFEQMGRVDAAVVIWRHVADVSEPHRVEALFKLHDLTVRLDPAAPVEDVLAELTLAPLTLPDRIRLAIISGQQDMILELSQYVAHGGDADEGIGFVEGAEISELLLDNGDIGIVDLLRRQRIPVGNAAKKVLDDVGFGALGELPRATNFSDARGVRSPQFMFPFESFLGLDPKPEGWPGTGRMPRRLLLVNASLGVGGAERQFVELVRALRASKSSPEHIEVALFSASKERGHAAFLPELEALGVIVHDLSEPIAGQQTLPPQVGALIEAFPAGLRDDVRRLWRLVDQTEPDAIHGWQDRSALACGIVGILLSVPRVVVSLRNMSPMTRRETSLLPLFELYREIASRENFVVTTNSRVAAEDYTRWLGLERDQIDLLPNGIDLARFTANGQDPARWTDPNRPIRIGGVFRLAANKRPFLWLKTVCALKELLDRPVLPLLFGDGPMKQQVRDAAADLGLHDLEIVKGKTEPDQIYGRIDMVLLTSRVEGVPNVLLEAQACGLPVVGCDAGGTREAMHAYGKSRGLLLPADVSPEQAAKEIRAWIGPALTVKGEARRNFVRRRFSADATAETAMAFYQGRAGSSA